MRIRLQLVSVFVIAALMLSCSGGKMNLTDMSTKGFQISYQPKAGSTAKYHMVSNSDITQTMMGQEQNFGTKIDLGMNLMVSNAGQDGIAYDVTYADVSVESNSPGLTGISDYKKQLQSSTFKLNSDLSGNVTKISGTDEIKKLALGTNIDLGLKSMFVVFPKKNLKVGDSWPHEEKNTVKNGPMTIDVNSKTKYKFAGVETFQNRECLKFDFESSSKLTGTGNQQGMDLEFDGSSTGKGVIYFDYVNGFLVSSSSNETIEGVVAVPSQGMDIPMTIVQSSKMQMSE